MTEQFDDAGEQSTIEAVASPGTTAVAILLFVLVTSAVVLLVSVALGIAVVAVIHVVARWTQFPAFHILVATISVLLIFVLFIVTSKLTSRLSEIRDSFEGGTENSYGLLGQLIAENAFSSMKRKGASARSRRRTKPKSAADKIQ